MGFTLGACPLSPDVALHGKDAGHIVELLGHVLADAFQLAATRAGGGCRLVAYLAPGQVRWQGQALGPLLGLGWGGLGRREVLDFGSHGGQVTIELFVQQALLLGVKAFGLGGELHAFQERVLVLEFVQQRLLMPQLTQQSMGELA